MILPLYRFGTSIVYPFVSLVGKKRLADGDDFWSGRLGRVESAEKGAVWIHAASAGEVKIVSYLAGELSKRQPQLPLFGSSQTRTGFESAKEIYPVQMRVSSFPLDCPQSVRRALSNVSPSVIVIAETEIWFNFLSEAFLRNIPVVQVNGRMSEKAFGGYKKIGGTMKKLLGSYSKIFCKSEEDAVRYRALGAAEDKVRVVGDMKFDAPLLPRSAGRIAELRSRLSVADDQFLLVAGSTRPGEEEQLARMMTALKERRPKLVCAPRHIQRSDEIVRLFKGAGFATVKYSEGHKEADVTVVDQFGLLNELYMAADCAFVGGTLVEIGGHNILEPVWSGVPVLFGWSIDNIEESVEFVTNHNYGRMVRDVDQMIETVQMLRSGAHRFEHINNRSEAESPTGIAADYILELTANA